MKLLYCSTFMFRRVENKIFALPSCADPFFQKYLEVFDSVKVLGIPVRSYLDKSALVEMTDSRINVRIVKSNNSPIEFFNDAEVKNILYNEISKAEAILIKPASRRGMMAINIAEKLHKPYMIEMTGDIHNALKQHPNILKRLYAPFLYRQIKNAIRNCEFGLYVSQEYLQQQFPIKGLMCGCSDVVIERSEETVLSKRLHRIDTMNNRTVIDIALIGFYQGKMKGVDTAIRALAEMPENFHLNILGNGTEANREFWFHYAEKCGISRVRERITFPKPLDNAHAVLEWLDTQDFMILPSLSEGLCRCLVEALSRGCVCFATNICSMPELLPNSCLHPKKDAHALANLILDAYRNPTSMKNMAKRNFYHSRNYDFEVLKEKRNLFLNQFKEYCKNTKR